MSNLDDKSEQGYKNVAKIPPAQRSAAEEAFVRQGSNMQSVRNEDFAAREAERTGR